MSRKVRVNWKRRVVIIILFIWLASVINRVINVLFSWCVVRCCPRAASVDIKVMVCMAADRWRGLAAAACTVHGATLAR